MKKKFRITPNEGEEKKEMTEEEKAEFRYKNMYLIEEYETFLRFTERGEETALLLFNIYYQLTRIADHLKGEKSPIK